MKKAIPNTPAAKPVSAKPVSEKSGSAKRDSAAGPASGRTAGVTVIHFDQGKDVRAIARERLGPVKPGQVIPDKKFRKKPKHKLPAGTESEAE